MRSSAEQRLLMPDGMLSKPLPLPVLPQPDPKSTDSPNSTDGLSLTTSGTGTDVGDGAVEVITFAIELDGDAGFFSGELVFFGGSGGGVSSTGD